jgi:hypothetical protein
MDRIMASSQSGNPMPQPLRPLANVGILISRWEEAMSQQDTSAMSLRQEIQKQIPENMSSDKDADWSLWAGHQVPFAHP